MIKNNIKEFITKYGSIDIVSSINIFGNFLFDKNIDDLIIELNDITIPLSCEIFENISNELYFWRYNLTDEDDPFNKIRELWIKIPETNNFFKITLIFKIDFLSNIVKTCQLNSNFLFQKKEMVLENLSVKKLNLKFIKQFIRHDYLGNIYCMNEKDYIDYLIKNSKLADKYYNSDFVNLMKIFVENTENTYKMFKMIQILLLGNDDHVDIAGLLLGLTKEKKIVKNNFHDFTYENLTFYLQSKVKKSNNNIKNNLEKIKDINIEDIDYKKQVIVNKYIPQKVKTMV